MKRPSVPQCILALYGATYLLLGIRSDSWNAFGTDYRIYFDALHRAQAGANPYFPFNIGYGFLYHPFSLTLLSAFGWLQYRASEQAWTVASLVSWVLCLWLLLRRLERRAMVVPLVAFCAFAPLWETLRVGQINTFVVLCICLSFLLSDGGHDGAAGLVLALAIVLKTSPALLLLYFVARQRYTTVLSALASLALFTGIAVAQFGTHSLTAFIGILPRIGLTAFVSPNNESAVATGTAALQGLGFSAAVPIFTFAYRAGFLVLLAWLVTRGRGMPPVWLYAAFVLLMVQFSPLTWYHHFTYLVVPLAVLLAQASWRDRTAGLVALLLLQSEHVFDYYVFAWPVPVLLAQAVLLLAVGRHCARPTAALSGQRPPAARGIADHPAALSGITAGS